MPPWARARMTIWCGCWPRMRARVGGGVRTVERARALVAQGAHRVIVGTAAFVRTGSTRHSCGMIVRRSAASADRRARFQARRIVVKGWREATELTAEEVIRRWSLTAAASCALTWIRKGCCRAPISTGSAACALPRARDHGRRRHHHARGSASADGDEHPCRPGHGGLHRPAGSSGATPASASPSANMLP